MLIRGSACCLAGFENIPNDARKASPASCHDHMPSLASYVASHGQHQSDKRTPAQSVRGSVNQCQVKTVLFHILSYRVSQFPWFTKDEFSTIEIASTPDTDEQDDG